MVAPTFTTRGKVAIGAGVTAAALILGAGIVQATSSDTPPPDFLDQCRAVVSASPTLSSSQRNFARNCVAVGEYRRPTVRPTPPPATSNAGASPTVGAPPSSPAATSGPTPTPSPTIIPPGQGWPDASNTGYRWTGVVLSVYNGPKTITASGTTLDSVQISGDVCITGSNVRITRSQIVGTVSTGSGTPYGGCPSSSIPSGVVLEDVQVLGPGVATSQNVNIAATFALSVDGFECNRCDISRWGSGVYVHRNVLIQNSWVHELVGYRGCSPILGPDCLAHRSGIGGNGAVNARYIHNTVQADSYNNVPGISGAIVLYSQAQFLPARDVEIRGNLLTANGASYCLYAGNGDVSPTNVTVTGNRFARGQSNQCGLYGAITYAGDVQFSDNRYVDGAVVPL